MAMATDEGGGGGPGSDTTAIHDDVAGEIAAITEKVSPIAADLVVIEDSAAGNAKKRVQLGNLPGSGAAPLSAEYVVVSLNGTLTGERRIQAEATVLALTDGGANGDLTVSVAANGITNAKLRQSGALAVVGRSANSTGNVADIQATAATGAVLRESGSVIGFGTIATAGIAANAVDNTIIRDSGALSVIGRSANSSGDPADISASAASGAVLRESGSTVGFGTVATAGLAANAVTDAILRQGTARTVVGRSANSTGNVADIAGSTAGFALTDDGTTVAFRALDTIGEDLNLTGDLTPATLSAGDNNDYAPTNFATSTVLRITPHAQGSALTGLAAGTDGRLIIIKNVASASALRIKNENASSTAANRFSQNFDLYLNPGDAITLIYDSTLSRWTATEQRLTDHINRPDPILEDFISGSAESGEVGLYGWTSTNFGLVSINAVQNHPGVIQVQSGSSIGVVNRFRLSDADTATLLREDEWSEMVMIFAPATATFDLDFRHGLMNNASSNPPSDGVYVEKLNTDTNYFLVTRQASTQTRTDTGVAAANGTYIKIRARKNGASNIDWFANDVFVVQSTTNQPAAGTTLLPVHQQTPTATNARSWTLDLFHLYFNNMTR